jgi:hypothetical protein
MPWREPSPEAQTDAVLGVSFISIFFVFAVLLDGTFGVKSKATLPILQKYINILGYSTVFLYFFNKIGGVVVLTGKMLIFVP